MVLIFKFLMKGRYVKREWNEYNYQKRMKKLVTLLSFKILPKPYEHVIHNHT